MNLFKRGLIPVYSFFFGFICILGNSFAIAETSVKDLKNELPLQAERSSPIWTLYGGLAAGYGLVSSNTYSETPQGTQFLFNGALAYQYKKWVFDAGVGWFYSNISGKTSTSQPVQVTMRSGLLEVSPRYRVSDTWQLGPVFNMAFGTDTSFGSSINPSSSSTFLGLKGVYEVPFEKLPLRLWAQLSTDLAIDNQRVYLGLIGVQIGIPIKTASIPQKANGSQKPVPQKVRIALDPQKVFFGTASAALVDDVDITLKELGRYLKQNEESSTVEVTGHADQRGKFNYNLKLSQQRAEAVRAALVSGGAEPSKLTLHAYSFLHPLDPANEQSAWAKNRRVEIIFNDIEAPEQLIEKLRPLALELPWTAEKDWENQS